MCTRPLSVGKKMLKSKLSENFISGEISRFFYIKQSLYLYFLMNIRTQKGQKSKKQPQFLS